MKYLVAISLAALVAGCSAPSQYQPTPAPVIPAIEAEDFRREEPQAEIERPAPELAAEEYLSANGEVCRKTGAAAICSANGETIAVESIISGSI